LIAIALAAGDSGRDSCCLKNQNIFLPFTIQVITRHETYTFFFVIRLSDTILKYYLRAMPFRCCGLFPLTFQTTNDFS